MYESFNIRNLQGNPVEVRKYFASIDAPPPPPATHKTSRKRGVSFAVREEEEEEDAAVRERGRNFNELVKKYTDTPPPSMMLESVHDEDVPDGESGDC